MASTSGNLYESIALGPKAIQIIGSSGGNTAGAKQVTADAGVVQCLGDFADSTLQQIVTNYNDSARSEEVRARISANWTHGLGRQFEAIR